MSEQTFQLISIVAAVVTTYLTYLTLRVSREKHDLERQLSALKTQVARSDGRVTQLESWCQTVSTTLDEDITIIVLGPRNSGKTSLVRLWCQPWADIRRESPTESWEDYYRPVLEYQDGTFFDEQISLQRIRKRRLRYHVRDYAGEDRYRSKALDVLAKLEGDAILVLCISAADPVSLNAEAAKTANYYSAAFLRECRETIARFGGRLMMVPIVFTKVDVLDANESQSIDALQEQLTRVHANTMANVQAIFGGKERVYLTSAITNREVLNLLRDLTLKYVSLDGKSVITSHHWV